MANLFADTVGNSAARHALTEHEHKRQIVRDYFEAYQTGDRSRIEDLVAPNLRFTSPQDDGIDRQSYFERCWPMSELQAGNEVEQVFVEGDLAYVTYLLKMKDGRMSRNTELMTIHDGKITDIVVFFGPVYKAGNMILPEVAAAV